MTGRPFVGYRKRPTTETTSPGSHQNRGMFAFEPKRKINFRALPNRYAAVFGQLPRS